MKVINLCKSYAVKKGESVQALKNVSFELPDRGMIFIEGKSGCGKTTLLNILGGLDSADEGEIEYHGKNLRDFTAKETDEYRNACCGFVFQEYNLIPELSAGENVALAMQLQGEKQTAEKVSAALERVGLKGYENRKISQLSGGQKQRVAIARALVKEPELILADEPTGALDGQAGESVFRLLKEISEEKLVLVVTHDGKSAEKYGDGIIGLRDGRVVKNSVKAEKREWGEMKRKKARMPFKAALKIGGGNFRRHPIRAAATVLFSVVAFTFLGVSLSIATIDGVGVLTDAMVKRDFGYTAVYKNRVYIPENRVDQSLDRFLGASPYSEEKTEMTASDADALCGRTGATCSLVYKADIFSFQYSIPGDVNDWNAAILAEKDKHFSVSADGYMAIDEAECEKAGFTVAGRLPQNPSEVAISECLLNTIKRFGYREHENDETVLEIASAEDLVGREISVAHNTSIASYRTITGVVFSDCRKEQYGGDRVKDCYHDKIYVSKDYFPSYTYALLQLPRERNPLKKFVSGVLEHKDADGSFFTFENDLSEGYYSADDLAGMMKTLCAYISVIFLFFAFLLLCSFISASIRRQTKQIGLLFAMGADFKGVCKIYFGGMAVSGGAIFALSLAVTGGGVAWLNRYFAAERGILFNLVSLSPIAVLCLAACIAVAILLGCVVPLLRLRKIRPATAINRGQLK